VPPTSIFFAELHPAASQDEKIIKQESVATMRTLQSSKSAFVCRRKVHHEVITAGSQAVVGPASASAQPQPQPSEHIASLVRV